MVPSLNFRKGSCVVGNILTTSVGKSIFEILAIICLLQSFKEKASIGLKELFSINWSLRFPSPSFASV